MKLPDLPVENVQPVQGYGEAEYALQHQGYAGQVLGRAVGETSQALGHLALTIRAGQQQVQALKARKDLQAFQTQALGKLQAQQTISWDELSSFYGGEQNVPKEITDAIPGGVKNTIKTPDGTTHEVGRPDIPMYAIRAQMFKHLVDPNIEHVSKNIDEPGWRRAFELGARTDLEEKVAQQAKLDTFEAVQDVNATAINQFNEALRSGDWATADLALQMGGETIKPAVRQHMELQKRIAMAEWDPNEIISGEDITRLQSLKEGLQNVNANHGKFTVKDSVGQEDEIDTAALTEKQRRGYVRMADAKIRQLSHLKNAEDGAEEKQRLNAAYGLLNRLYEGGDVQGLRNFAGDMNRAGLSKEFQNQEKLLRVYETAAQLAGKLDPKHKPPPKNNWAVMSLQHGLDQYSRGQEVTAIDPHTGKPFDFEAGTYDLGGALMEANAYSPALYKQLSDQMNGKKQTSAQQTQVIGRVTKALGYDLDEIAKLPRDVKYNQTREDAAQNALAVGESYREFAASHGGAPTPEQTARWEDGYLAQNAERTITQPGWRGMNTITGPIGIGDMPGRVRLQVQHLHETLGIPDNAEAQVAFYKEWYKPYAEALTEEYKKKFPGQTSVPIDFLVAAAAANRDNNQLMLSKKLTSAKERAKFIIDHIRWDPNASAAR